MKMCADQTALVKEVQEFKGHLLSMDQNMCDMATRISALETRCENLPSVRTGVEADQTPANKTAHLVSVLEARLDYAENQSRRNNLKILWSPGY